MTMTMLINDQHPPLQQAILILDIYKCLMCIKWQWWSQGGDVHDDVTDDHNDDNTYHDDEEDDSVGEDRGEKTLCSGQTGLSWW